MLPDDDDKSLTEELSESWDQQAGLYDQDAPDDKKADKDEKGYAEAFAEAWDELASKEEPSSAEFDEIYSEHKETLAQAGMTPASYTRAMIAFNRVVASNPYWYPAALESYQRGETMLHPFVQVHRLTELERFTKRHPDVRDPEMQVRMCEHMDLKPGESVGKALARAYEAAKRPKPKPGSAEEAWNQLGLGDHIG